MRPRRHRNTAANVITASEGFRDLLNLCLPRDPFPI